MRTGFVKFFSQRKGWGFVKDGEESFFLHYSKCDQSCRKNGTGMVTLQEGDLVSFDVEENPRGLKAVNVSKVKV